MIPASRLLGASDPFSGQVVVSNEPVEASQLMSRYSSCLLNSRRRCQSKEYEYGPIEA